MPFYQDLHKNNTQHLLQMILALGVPPLLAGERNLMKNQQHSVCDPLNIPSSVQYSAVLVG